MMVITGIIYPAAITVAANALFGDQAMFSIITGKDGVKYGGALLAQEFTGDRYLWGRTMNVDAGTFRDKNGAVLLYAGVSNRTPASYQAERIAASGNMTVEDVEAVIERYTTGRFLGITGESRVNVLKVNLALDGLI